MRLVCGKVDKMENWMTEISFGMTELDLKLRNIAHNIEGTAANVDDDAMSVARWAVPREDPDEMLKPATVTKKLGPNRKNVRMTGMVATIIDTLAVPAEERDASVTPSSGGSHRKKQSIAHAAKKVHKKRHKDDKDKHIDESTAEEPHKAIAVNDPVPIVQVPETKIEPLVKPIVEEIQALYPVKPVKSNDDGLKIAQAARSETQNTATVDSNSDHSEYESPPVVTERSAVVTEQAEHNHMAETPVVESQEPQSQAPLPDNEANTLPSVVLKTETDPVLSAAEIVISAPVAPEAEPLEVIELGTTESAESVEVVDSSVPTTIEPAIPMSVSHDGPLQAIDLVDQVPLSHDTETPAVQNEPISNSAAAIPENAASVSSQQVQLSTGEATSETSSASASPVIEATRMEPPAPAKRSIQSRAPSVRKILLATKAVRGRSDRAVLQKDGSTRQELPRISLSRPQAVQSDPETSRSQSRGGAASSSSESSSNSSEDDDGNSSSDDSQASRVEGGNVTNKAASMTRTITALKKLKKANVLSAEEEQELKERAQQKWFKLKGHMKEKKKKDVANILLKRKKNVFTVSARIELLEEKSRVRGLSPTLNVFGA